MNQNARDYISQLTTTDLSSLEYKKQLIATRNIGTLCHCSCNIEIDFIRYLSVNNMSLNENGNYFILLISNTSPANSEKHDGMELYNRAFTYTIIQEVAARIFTGHCMFYSCELDGHLVVILCFLHGTSEQDKSDGLAKYVALDCQKIVTLCKEQYDIDTSVYLSSLIEGIHPIASEYRKLLNYDVYQHFLCKDYLPSFLTLPAPFTKSNFTFYLLSAAKELCSSILNFKDYKACASDILDKIISGPIISVDELKTHFSNFFDFVCREFSDSGIPMHSDKLHQDFPVLIQKSLYWTDITNWFYQFIQESAVRYNTRYQSSGFQRIANIKTYIDEHYNNSELSVSYLADIFDMNQTFLSTAFKKQYKITLSSYVQQERLKHAENLLKNSSYTISDIVEKSGFGSTETFYRAFKKEFKLSPTQIRHINFKKSDGI